MMFFNYFYPEMLKVSGYTPDNPLNSFGARNRASSYFIDDFVSISAYYISLDTFARGLMMVKQN